MTKSSKLLKDHPVINELILKEFQANVQSAQYFSDQHRNLRWLKFIDKN